MRSLLFVFLLHAMAFGAIDGGDDSLILAGLSTTTDQPNRTMVAGWVRCDVMTTADGRTAQRGRISGNGNTSFGGPHISTTTNNNDWTTTDFEADVYWFYDVFDTLLDCCMGTAALDTQYIDSVIWTWNLAVKTALLDSLRGKIQGPVLNRPRAPNAISGSGSNFGGTGIDSSPCFNWFAINRPAANDTIFWRDSTVAGAPGFYDSSNILGDDATNDYELTITSGGNFTTRFDVGSHGEAGPTGNPILWNPTGVTQGTRVRVNVTPIFKTAMGSLASGHATMRSLGFGLIMPWVYFQATTSERIGKTLANTRGSIQVHNTTTGTSMALAVYFKTDLDTFCANKIKDGGVFRFPWYHRIHQLQGTERDRVQGKGENRKRP